MSNDNGRRLTEDMPANMPNSMNQRFVQGKQNGQQTVSKITKRWLGSLETDFLMGKICGTGVFGRDRDGAESSSRGEPMLGTWGGTCVRIAALTNAV